MGGFERKNKHRRSNIGAFFTHKVTRSRGWMWTLKKACILRFLLHDSEDIFTPQRNGLYSTVLMCALRFCSLPQSLRSRAGCKIRVLLSYTKKKSHITAGLWRGGEWRSEQDVEREGGEESGRVRRNRGGVRERKQGHTRTKFIEMLQYAVRSVLHTPLV